MELLDHPVFIYKKKTGDEIITLNKHQKVSHVYWERKFFSRGNTIIKGNQPWPLPSSSVTEGFIICIKGVTKKEHDIFVEKFNEFIRLHQFVEQL